MSSIKSKLQEIIELNNQQKNVEAVEKYYAEDVKVTQADGSSIQGKAEILESTKEYIENIESVKYDKCLSYLTSDKEGKSWDIYEFDLQHKTMGQMAGTQISEMKWENGLIKEVKFTMQD
ncbi:MAG: hypothetical protein AAGF07_01225 [Patescibacteria group bacterium]